MPTLTKSPIHGHDQQRLILKETDVDARIAPVVSWINAHRGCFTVGSCQGRQADRAEDSHINAKNGGPYVIFACWQMRDLIHINDALYDTPWKVTRFQPDGNVTQLAGLYKIQCRLNGPDNDWDRLLDNLCTYLADANLVPSAA